MKTFFKRHIMPSAVLVTILFSVSSNAGDVLSGSLNTSTGAIAVVAGGYDNHADADGAFVGGGIRNKANEFYSLITAGYENSASGKQSTIVGGANNTASGEGSYIGAGIKNVASEYSTVVIGGYNNRATGKQSTVAGGVNNEASGEGANISGGNSNKATSYTAVVSGGYGNVASGLGSFIGSGKANKAEGDYSVIGGGNANSTEFRYDTVGGGYDNNSSGANFYNPLLHIWGYYPATVAGGSSNTASGSYSAIGGGAYNIASGFSSVIGGGYKNTVSGSYSALVGGRESEISGDYSFGFGRKVKTSQDGVVIFGDSTDKAKSNGIYKNRFYGFFDNGYVLYTDTTGGGSVGVYLNHGDGAWNTISDKNKKENFEKVDGKKILEKLSHIPIMKWNYKSQDKSIKHIGPFSQDFYAAFKLGDNDKTISTIDPDGIALISIQTLYKMRKADEEKIKSLEKRIEKLEKLLLKK